MAGLAVFGVTGRMGQTLLRALREPAYSGGASGLRLVAAVAARGSARLGTDAVSNDEPAGVPVTADGNCALGGVDVAVDFSVAECVAEHARTCVLARVPLLVGATGLDESTRAELSAAALHVPVLIAPNTSLGVAVLAKLVELAARDLGGAVDVEISEAHHRMKRDSPSGTALALGEIVASARGRSLADVAVYERHGRGVPRAPGEIGFAVIRAGDIIGDHRVIFAADGERIEIAHSATDRLTFARGALRAAKWLVGRPPGSYRMADVLDPDQP